MLGPKLHTYYLCWASWIPRNRRALSGLSGWLHTGSMPLLSRPPLGTALWNSPGPGGAKGHINIRILDSGSKALDPDVPEAIVCRILLFLYHARYTIFDIPYYIDHFRILMLMWPFGLPRLCDPQPCTLSFHCADWLRGSCRCVAGSSLAASWGFGLIILISEGPDTVYTHT